MCQWWQAKGCPVWPREAFTAAQLLKHVWVSTFSSVELTDDISWGQRVLYLTFQVTKNILGTKKSFLENSNFCSTALCILDQHQTRSFSGGRIFWPSTQCSSSGILLFKTVSGKLEYEDFAVFTQADPLPSLNKQQTTKNVSSLRKTFDSGQFYRHVLERRSSTIKKISDFEIAGNCCVCHKNVCIRANVPFKFSYFTFKPT